MIHPLRHKWPHLLLPPTDIHSLLPGSGDFHPGLKGISSLLMGGVLCCPSGARAGAKRTVEVQGCADGKGRIMEECRDRDVLSRQQQLQDWEREGGGTGVPGGLVGAQGHKEPRARTGTETLSPVPLPPAQLPALLPAREEDSGPHSTPRAPQLHPGWSHSPAPQCSGPKGWKLPLSKAQQWSKCHQ